MILSKLNGIAARIAIAIVLAIIVGLMMAFGLSFGLNSYGSRQDRSPVASNSYILVAVMTHRNLAMLSGKIAITIRAAASVPQAERQKVIAIAAAAAPDMRIGLDEAAPLDAKAAADYNLDRFRKLVQIQLQGLSPPIIVGVGRQPVQTDRSGDRDQSGSASEEEAVLEAALPDGQRITFAITGVPSFGGGYVLPIFLGSLLCVAIFIAFLTARRLARPIREFARASERLGVDLTAPPLAVRGPLELRVTIQAFNRMQDRLRRFLEDRTQMLAAISHDLRAPLARLRLRAEFVEDEEQQRKMFAELATMNAMIDSTLAFARDATRQEPRKLVDLSVLVEDVCEDVADAGGAALYRGPRGIAVTCRPSDIRRAITNLVDNAVKYGGSAHVEMLREDNRVVIMIDDDGPGIPLKEQERVFAPFYRLEPSRDPGNGGVGLGLSVARTIVREHGGEVSLANREGGGLSVRVELPAEADALPDGTRQAIAGA
jgi:signal transduction histidine kinase